MSGCVMTETGLGFEGGAEVIGEFKLGNITARSPLRYPGGKTRALSTIRKFLPSGLDSICSPFFGGGSIELSCAADGMKVYGSDAFQPVVEFWNKALKEPVLLSEQVRRYYPLTKQEFYSLQRNYSKLTNTLSRAAVFYVLNRSSFSGTTLSGGMSLGHPRFTESSIQRLRDFKAGDVQVEYSDYKDALAKHADKFLYLDPPYANGGKLYGDRGSMHKGFSHGDLADLLKTRTDWLLSYNDCNEVRDLYSGYDVIVPEWAYGMNGNKSSNEILILG